MRKLLAIGGFASAAVLITFGIAAIVMGVNGRNTVQQSLSQENIVGSDDMTPALIKAAALEAGLPASTSFPTLSVAGKTIDTGAEARAFALHADSRARGIRWADLLAAAALCDRGTGRERMTPSSRCSRMASPWGTLPARRG
jgi:hypothetical protein